MRASCNNEAHSDGKYAHQHERLCPQMHTAPKPEGALHLHEMNERCLWFAPFVQSGGVLAFTAVLVNSSG